MPVLAPPPSPTSSRVKGEVSLRDDPDVALMLRVQRDESGAFEELVERFGPGFFRRYYQLLHDRQEAEDLTQEVLLRLYRHRKRYRPLARLTTWLYHITQNVARNALRRRMRNSVAGRGWLGHNELSEREAHPQRFQAPSMHLESRELAALVRSAVSKLAQRQRAALEMQHFQNLGYVEIARALGMTLKATKSLLYRARNRLRHDLATCADLSRT